MQSVAVVIPVYKADMDTYELISFRQCMHALNNHPAILVKPASLNIDHLLEVYPTCLVESFDDSYFENIDGYNKLLCSELFYERFLAYEYILIAQLDVFIFRDDLLEWCSRGYDYVGAPQFSTIRPKQMGWRSLREIGSLLYQQPLQNGGLSLRRVSACLRLLTVYHRFFNRWVGNEDSFFSLHYPRLLPFRPLMRIPSPQQALTFAVETEPRKSIRMIGGKLPMGCHAWAVYDLDFWRPIIRGYGYTI